MVIVMIGERKKNIKCHDLLSKLRLILMLNTINTPIIKGATNASIKSNHLVPMANFINWLLKNVTRNNRIPAITEPDIIDLFVAETSKKRPEARTLSGPLALTIFLKKFLINMKNAGIFLVKKCDILPNTV